MEVETVQYLNLQTNVGGVGGLDVVDGFASFEDKDDFGYRKFDASVMGNFALILLLLLLLPLPLHALNSELGFGFGFAEDDDGDGDDDFFEDPDSGGPCCAFPLPAFNGGHFIFLVGSTANLFLASLFLFLLLVQLLQTL